MMSYAGEVAYSRHVEAIIDAVCRQYHITRAALLSRDRHKCVAEARKVAFFLTRALTSLSYPEMGRAFGRDHTTVISGVRSVRVDSVGDAHLFELVERLRQEVLTEWAGAAE